MTRKYSVGAEYKLNLIPMWLNSPINCHVPVSVGYRQELNSMHKDNVYIMTGLEVNCGYITNYCSFFIKSEAGAVIPVDGSGAYPVCSVQAGIHLWLGKGW